MENRLQYEHFSVPIKVASQGSTVVSSTLYAEVIWMLETAQRVNMQQVSITNKAPHNLPHLVQNKQAKSFYLIWTLHVILFTGEQNLNQ